MKFVEKRKTPISENAICSRQPNLSRPFESTTITNINAEANRKRQQVDTGGATAKPEFTFSAYHEADQENTVMT